MFEQKIINFNFKSDLEVKLASENIPVHIIGVDEDFKLVFSFDNDDQEENQSVIDQLSYKYIEDSNFFSLDLIDIDIPKMKVDPTKQGYEKFKLMLNISKSILQKVELFVPKNTNINAETENGSIKVKHAKGNHNLISENGLLKLDKCEGDSKIETENGKIRLYRCTGNFSCLTENGKIDIEDFDGNLKTQTENGKTNLLRCKGEELQIQSENGSIKCSKMDVKKADVRCENGSQYYEFNQIEDGDFLFENENGRIQLIIPETIPYHLVLSNELGSISIGLEGPYEKKDIEGHKVIDKVNSSGKVEIYAKNETGSISVLKNSGQKADTKINGGMDFDFNFDELGENLESMMKNLNKKIDPEKISKKVEKALKKVEIISQNIDVDKIKNAIFEGFNKATDFTKHYAEQETPEPTQSQQQPEDVICLKDERFRDADSSQKDNTEEASIINQTIKNVKDKILEEFHQKELTFLEKDEVKKHSRMKILELLQNGKINISEAEELLNAMEEE